MEWLLNLLGAIGAYMILALVGLLPFVAAFFGYDLGAGREDGRSHGRHWQRRVVGFVIGSLAFALALALFGPSMNALLSVQCQASDDYQACMDGED